jgi:hypothetical protein
MVEHFETGQSNQNFSETPNDPRISRVKSELVEAGRAIIDDKLSILVSDLDKESRPYCIQFGSDDRLKYVELNDDMYYREDYAFRNLPSPLQKHERIQPLKLERFKNPDSGIYNEPDYTDLLWISLDEAIPTIYQLVGKDGEPINNDDVKISGEEAVVKRPDLLSDILDAVSGEGRRMM